MKSHRLSVAIHRTSSYMEDKFMATIPSLLVASPWTAPPTEVIESLQSEDQGLIDSQWLRGKTLPEEAAAASTDSSEP